MSSKGIFITGTDTGVGKTIVAATISRYLMRRGVSVGVLKPVTSGAETRNGQLVSHDAELLAWAAGSCDPSELSSPYILREPLAPSEAATREGVTIEAGRVIDSFNRLAACHDYVVVEGAGGLLVPLADSLLVADLVLQLQLPMVIVARPGLGTVNHTLMTWECARSRGIRVLGVIICNQQTPPDMTEVYAPALIERFSGIPVLGVFPAHGAHDESLIVEHLSGIVRNHPLADILAKETGI
jgi:dethiobiotin synthetase